MAVWVVASRAADQTPAGLSIRDTVGSVYSIQYVTNRTQRSKASAWRCLEFVQLPASPYLWTDKSAPATGKRFYRAVLFAAPTNLVFIPPGTFRTNPWGLYDMHGNVLQWCQDWFDTYPGGTAMDPQEPPQGPASGSYRVLRGGAWISYAGACRSACRNDFHPDRGLTFMGFRVVLAPGQH